MNTQFSYLRPRTIAIVVLSGLVTLVVMTAYAASKGALTMSEAVWLIAFALVGGCTYLALECRNSMVASRRGRPSA